MLSASLLLVIKSKQRHVPCLVTLIYTSQSSYVFALLKAGLSTKCMSYMHQCWQWSRWVAIHFNLIFPVPIDPPTRFSTNLITFPSWNSLLSLHVCVTRQDYYLIRLPSSPSSLRKKEKTSMQHTPHFYVLSLPHTHTHTQMKGKKRKGFCVLWWFSNLQAILGQGLNQYVSSQIIQQPSVLSPAPLIFFAISLSSWLFSQAV